MMEDKIELKSWALLLLLSCIWGASFILIKKSLISFSYDEVASLRMFISMVALIPFMFVHLKKVDWKKDGKGLLLVAIFGNALPAFLYPIAQTQISSGLTGILNAMTPLSVLILGVLFFNLKVGWQKLMGVSIGLIGAVILIAFGKSLGLGDKNWFGIFALLGTVSYGFSSNIIKRSLQNIPALTSSVAIFLLIGPLALVYLLGFTDVVSQLQSDPNVWTSVASVTFLGVVSTVFSLYIFIKLVQQTNQVFGSMVSYIIPIVALTFAFFDGEMITITHIMGLVLIISGVYLVQRK